jgi:hypothetical protein
MDAPLKSSKEDKTSGQTAAVGPNHTGMWHLPATSLIYLNPRCGDKPAAGHIYISRAGDGDGSERRENLIRGGGVGGPWNGGRKRKRKKEKA